ncbi:hypothetical protein EXIGLDRAFT_672787 [Exidia glandulosa HHB12029]|uniref:Uncharacterized protein n=1 Tax=Exidia glandulosa HHB12029 TaxID=1314781 RepID=A0A165JDI0_EXIGL|nr:hypothetical protein EXIGLDRAFT_672787 [Exidia glandulosa HHB12029]
MEVELSEQQLFDRLQSIFSRHPLVRYDQEDAGQPSLPAHALVQVFQQLAKDLGRSLLSPDEQTSLQAIVDTAAVDVTVDQVQHIVPHLFPDLHVSAFSPVLSPVALEPRPPSQLSDHADNQVVFRSRSSSPEPGMENVKRTAMPPGTPQPLSQIRVASLSGIASSSPFDARQRSTPLAPAGPNARIRRPLAIVRRRRSDSASTANNSVLSDSEGGRPLSPRSGTVSPRSIPTSPSGSVSFSSFMPWPQSPEAPLTTSLPRSVSQPLPRHRSRPEPQFSSIDEIDYDDYSEPQSPSEEIDQALRFASLNDTPRRRTLSEADRYYDEEEDDALGLVHAPPSHRPSNASLAPQDRVDALARENAELMRRLNESERHMQTQIAEQEAEFETLESRLSEAQHELQHVKREEKELRHKERGNTTQISMLETEIAKLQRHLDTARVGYQSMQRQYQDQMAATEALRNALRTKEAEVQHAADVAAHHLSEARRHAAAREAADAQAAQLEDELQVARETAQSVLEQKNENVMLRETIERLKLDLDELRSNRSEPSRSGSRPATVSRTLGAELLIQLADAERKRFLESGGSLGGSDSVARTLQDMEVFELDSETEPERPKSSEPKEEYESVYETFITRRTRGPRSMASLTLSPSRFLSPPALFFDALVQHDPTDISSAIGIQTDEIDTSGSEPSTSPPDAPSAISLPRTPPVQTPSSHRRSVEEDDYEDDLYDLLVRPPMSPTSPIRPRAKSKSSELPPSYAQLFHAPAPNPKALVARDTIAHWHRGAPIPLAPVPGGVSHGARRAWARLKGELGVECMVIEKIIAVSAARTPPATPTQSLRRRRSSISSSTPATAPSPAPRQTKPAKKSKKSKTSARRAAGWRFVDLLSVYAARNRLPHKLFYPIVVLGAWTAVVVVATPFVTHYFAVPGMPDLADRAALVALRSIAGGASEGFVGNVGPAKFDAVWKVVEHLLLGSASAVLRVPT